MPALALLPHVIAPSGNWLRRLPGRNRSTSVRDPPGRLCCTHRDACLAPQVTDAGEPGSGTGQGRRLPRLGSTLSAAAGAAQTGSEIAASSGRWVKLTPQSAQALKKYPLMKGSGPGVSRAVLTENGKIKGILELARPGSFLTNPALLAGAAGLIDRKSVV